MATPTELFINSELPKRPYTNQFPLTAGHVPVADGNGLQTTFRALDVADVANAASESYVDTAISNLVDSAPGTLDTLNELAAALGDDENFSSTVATSLGNRLRVDVNDQGLTLTQKQNGLDNLGITEVITDASINSSGLITFAKNTGQSSDTVQIPTAISGLSFDANTGILTSSYTNGATSTTITVAANEVADNVFRIKDNDDATKKIAFEASGITAGQTRTITVPDSNVDLGKVSQAASTSTDGYLTSADWNTFNSKQDSSITSIPANTSLTLTAGRRYLAENTAIGQTYTLPGSPSKGWCIEINGMDFATYKQTVARNGSTINGLTSNYSLTRNGTYTFIYTGTTWLAKYAEEQQFNYFKANTYYPQFSIIGYGRELLFNPTSLTTGATINLSQWNKLCDNGSLSYIVGSQTLESGQICYIGSRNGGGASVTSDMTLTLPSGSSTDSNMARDEPITIITGNSTSAITLSAPDATLGIVGFNSATGTSTLTLPRNMRGVIITLVPFYNTAFTQWGWRVQYAGNPIEVELTASNTNQQLVVGRTYYLPQYYQGAINLTAPSGAAIGDWFIIESRYSNGIDGATGVNLTALGLTMSAGEFVTGWGNITSPTAISLLNMNNSSHSSPNFTAGCSFKFTKVTSTMWAMQPSYGSVLPAKFQMKIPGANSGGAIFDASNITAGTYSTITIPSANVNLGDLPSVAVTNTNNLTNAAARILGGSGGTASKPNAIIITGEGNTANGGQSVILTGRGVNTTLGGAVVHGPYQTTLATLGAIKQSAVLVGRTLNAASSVLDCTAGGAVTNSGDTGSIGATTANGISGQTNGSGIHELVVTAKSITGAFQAFSAKYIVSCSYNGTTYSIDAVTTQHMSSRNGDGMSVAFSISSGYLIITITNTTNTGDVWWSGYMDSMYI